MSTRSFADLQAFSKEFPDYMMGILRNAIREAHRELQTATRSAVEALIPVKTGALKASVRDEPGSPQSAIDALQPTKVVIPGSDKAWIINRGRKRAPKSFTVRGKRGNFTVKAGKMLGSKQAPQGIRGPALKRVKALEPQILDAAIAKAEAG